MSSGGSRHPFPIDGSLTFLNHGSFGSCPRPVLDVQTRLRERIESNPITFLLEAGEPLIDASRTELARLVGADPEALAFVTNATTGVNTVLRSLRFEPGDRILILDQAYNACANAARAVAAAVGAHVDVAPVPFPISDPDDAVDSVIAHLTERTRLVLLDHVTSTTALVLPVESLVAAIEARGIAVLIDGAHAPGMVPLDVDALGASFYTGNCHKWICAPKGAGFLHVRADHRDRVRPLVTSHGANLRRPGRSEFHDLFDWCGTFDPTPWICVGEAIRFMADTYGGWSAVMEANRELALAGRDLLVAALGVELPAPDSMIGSMATVPLPPSDEPPTENRYMPHALQVRLRERHAIEVPVVTWPEPPGRALRISMQRYNTLDDVRRLVEALQVELRA